MKRDHKKMFMIALLLLSFTLLLNSCSRGGSSSDSGATFIAAELNSFLTGSAPQNYQNAVARVQDGSGSIITAATVTMNGVTLNYNVITKEYEGVVTVSPGDSVTLSVNVDNNTYTASGTQFTSYPIISAPMAGATWHANVANTVTWSPGFPTANAFYGLGVLDAGDPNGQLVWPTGNGLQFVSMGTNSFSIAANMLSVGNRLVVAGIAIVIPISNAADGSSLVIGGLDNVQITVIGN